MTAERMSGQIAAVTAFCYGLFFTVVSLIPFLTYDMGAGISVAYLPGYWASIDQLFLSHFPKLAFHLRYLLWIMMFVFMRLHLCVSNVTAGNQWNATQCHSTFDLDEIT